MAIGIWTYKDQSEMEYFMMSSATKNKTERLWIYGAISYRMKPKG